MDADRYGLELLLSQFDASRGIARARYARFVAEGMSEGHRPEFYRVSRAVAQLEPIAVEGGTSLSRLERHRCTCIKSQYRNIAILTLWIFCG